MYLLVMCVWVFLPVVASAIISQTLTLFFINSFSDVLTLTNICKNVRKTRVFKKGERISCGHQHSHRHNTTPLHFVQNFYCRRSRFLPFKIIYRSSSNSQGNKRCNNERINSVIFVDILLIHLFKKLKKINCVSDWLKYYWYFTKAYIYALGSQRVNEYIKPILVSFYKSL